MLACSSATSALRTVRRLVCAIRAMAVIPGQAMPSLLVCRNKIVYTVHAAKPMAGIISTAS